MKPIIFSAPMVQALQDNRKTQTRRVVKPQPDMVLLNDKKRKPFAFYDGEKWNKSKYQPDDILWVRETWGSYAYDNPESNSAYYMYRADYPIGDKGYWYEQEQTNWCDFPRWRPSIHMPKEAARIFLTVKNVRVERVQDITPGDIAAEGLPSFIISPGHVYYKDVCGENWLGFDWYRKLWNSIYAAPQPVKKHGIITHYESYPWEDMQETREHRGLPWIVCGNPWVWVVEFEGRDEKC